MTYHMTVYDNVRQDAESEHEAYLRERATVKEFVRRNGCWNVNAGELHSLTNVQRGGRDYWVEFDSSAWTGRK